MRKSTISTKHDGVGDYEVETFDCENPKRVIVCAHGGGVRRWDGEKFFYGVAEHYNDSNVWLVDQNQQNGEYITLPPLYIAVARINDLITKAKASHPGVPIIVIAHSFGCGVVTQLDLSGVSLVVFVTPAPGKSFENYVKSYGKDAEKGKKVTTNDGLKKEFTAEFMKSIKGLSW